jgi:Na+/melibiose symporter-like transporter
MALTPLLIKKFNERKVYIAMSLYGFIAGIALYFVAVWTNYNIAILLPLLFFHALNFGGLNIIPLIMVADSVDYYEHKTGRRTEGVAYAVFTFTFKVTLALGSALALILLAAFNYGDLGSVGANDSAIRNGVWFTFMVVPAITSLLAAIPLFWYKLVGKEKQRISEELKIMRAERAEAVNEN